MMNAIQVNGSKQLHDYSLVLSAADIAHTVHQMDSAHWEIHVDINQLARARAEIDAYTLESANWPPRSLPLDSFSPVFRLQSLFIITTLAIIYAMTGDWHPESPWFDAGAIDSAAILEDHQYYRLLTSLTLHADLVHLLGNCLIGAFLLHFYFLLVGNGLGGSILLASSVAANYLNVYGHGPGHHSVGFSTAIFAVIGILSALNYRHYGLTRPARLLFPIMAGASMLAFLGSGGERTDLGAHFYGLVSGLIFGFFLSLKTVFNLRRSLILQLLLVIGNALTVYVCWYLATLNSTDFGATF